MSLLLTVYPPNHGRGKSRKSKYDRRHRERLFREQEGKCHWCRQQMEMEPLKVTPSGKIKHNKAFATFEHLIPLEEGGVTGIVNRVLAHGSCNNNRKKRKWPHDPVYGASSGAAPVVALKANGSESCGSRHVGAPPIKQTIQEWIAAAKDVLPTCQNYELFR